MNQPNKRFCVELHLRNLAETGRCQLRSCRLRKGDSIVKDKAWQTGGMLTYGPFPNYVLEGGHQAICTEYGAPIAIELMLCRHVSRADCHCLLSLGRNT